MEIAQYYVMRGTLRGEEYHVFFLSCDICLLGKGLPVIATRDGATYNDSKKLFWFIAKSLHIV